MKKVLIIYGGMSEEHDISIRSYNMVVNNIDKTKYIVDSIYVTKDNIWLNNSKKIDNIIEFIKSFDIVFPIIHGYSGEDGKLQGMLDLFNIKYVGSKCGSSYICMDKIRTKEILKNYNIPIVKYQIDLDNISINYPIIVKPSCGGSSIGISVAYNKEELKEKIDNAYKYDKKVLLEEFLSNPIEIECACIKDNNNLLIEIGTIEQNSLFYDYKTKYENDTIVTNLNPNISKEIINLVKEYSKKIFKILDLSGYARIDFLYKDKLYLNEINTIPGFTDISMFPMLINKLGISYKDIISKLIDNELYN